MEVSEVWLYFAIAKVHYSLQKQMFIPVAARKATTGEKRKEDQKDVCVRRADNHLLEPWFCKRDFEFLLPFSCLRISVCFRGSTLANRMSSSGWFYWLNFYWLIPKILAIVLKCWWRRVWVTLQNQHKMPFRHLNLKQGKIFAAALVKKKKLQRSCMRYIRSRTSAILFWGLCNC